MPDLCRRCGLPLATEVGPGGCFGGLAESGDLACRDRELAATQRALEATRALLERSRLLLVKSRDALDLAVFELGEIEGAAK